MKTIKTSSYIKNKYKNSKVKVASFSFTDEFETIIHDRPVIATIEVEKADPSTGYSGNIAVLSVIDQENGDAIDFSDKDEDIIVREYEDQTAPRDANADDEQYHAGIYRGRL